MEQNIIKKEKKRKSYSFLECQEISAWSEQQPTDRDQGYLNQFHTHKSGQAF